MNEHCLEIESLLAGYALEAISFEERLQVETHIDTCESCRATLEDYQSISDGLLGAVIPVQPPSRLRARLLAKTIPGPVKSGWFKRWSSLIPRLANVTALVAILVLVVLNINLLHNTNQLMQTYQTLIQQNQANQTAFALLTYPESQVAVIDDQNIYGTLVYDPGGQVAVLNVWGLEKLPGAQEYQVWLIEPDQTRVSGGVFQSLDDMDYISFVIESPSSLDSFTGIGITIEPEGGSPGPTGPRVFGVEL